MISTLVKREHWNRGHIVRTELRRSFHPDANFFPPVFGLFASWPSLAALPSHQVLSFSADYSHSASFHDSYLVVSGGASFAVEHEGHS